MKGIFTILNYYFSPGRWAAQWPLTTAPAAVGDRNLQSGKGLQYSEHFFPKYKYQPGNEAESTEITQKAVIWFFIMYLFSADSCVIAWTEIKEQEQVRLEQF